MPVESSRERLAANRERGTTPSRNPSLLEDRARMNQLERRVNDLAQAVAGLTASNKSLQGQLTDAQRRIQQLERAQGVSPRDGLRVKGDDGSVTHIY